MQEDIREDILSEKERFAGKESIGLENVGLENTKQNIGQESIEQNSGQINNLVSVEKSSVESIEELNDRGFGQESSEQSLEQKLVGQKLTPLMQQYFKIRVKYPDILLMFQVGDFYEMFFEDAKKASAFLGIALTKRGTFDGKPIPLCGVPVHTMEHHLGKLVRAGFKVGVCDQLEEAVPGKVVERGITRVFTPGTIVDSKLLDEKSASYLFSFFPAEDKLGLLFGELLTAQLYATVLPIAANKALESELIRFFPDEILLPNNKNGRAYQSTFKSMGYFTTLENLDLENNDYLEDMHKWIGAQFDKNIVENLENSKPVLYALYNFYNYVNKNQVGAIEHFKSVNFYEPDDFLILDPATQKNLELIKNNQDASRKNSLFSVLDRAVTSMGSRTIKKWLLRPLVNKEAIELRLDAVQTMVKEVDVAQKVRESLSSISDIERVVGRIALRKAQVQDYVQLHGALCFVPDLRDALMQVPETMLLKIIASNFGDFSGIKNLIENSINTDETQDFIIKFGYDKKLDELRELVFNSNNKILELEEKEKKETGIASLKIGYNRVSGYYIEITKTNLHLVPSHYTRESTLSNRERFTCRELRDMQDGIVRAKSQIAQVENEIFESIKNKVRNHVQELRKFANALATLDALLSFSNVAYEQNYCRPVFNLLEKGNTGNANNYGQLISSEFCTGDILVKAGRHPVVEIVEDIDFVANDIVLNKSQSLWIITGPNMGGKSTFLRQTALISIMAQCGSFVPAQSACLSILDRVFTRIGSGDNLAGGKSTFLVEMEETALICNQATKNSLVILDEVGRGTSTYDGFAIAKAVVEYIYKKVGAKCLFATHYHELCDLQEVFPGIASYYAASKKHKDGIIFLYKMVKGVADGSFGIEVAKLADLPISLIKRAEEILHDLHNHAANSDKAFQQGLFGCAMPDAKSGELLASSGNQKFEHQKFENEKLEYEKLIKQNYDLERQLRDLSTKINEGERVIESLKSLDFDELSPKRALDFLWEMKKSVYENTKN